MINWELTSQQLNRTDLSGHRPKVIMQCDKCGVTASIAIRHKNTVIDGQLPWECTKCIANRPEKKEKSKAGAVKAWKDPQYRKQITANSKQIWEDEGLAQRMSAFRNSKDFKERMVEINRDPNHYNHGFREKHAELGKKRWEDPEYRNRMFAILTKVSQKAWTTPEYRTKIKQIMLSKWKDDNYRKMIIASMVEKWCDPDHKKYMLSIFGSDEFRSKMSEVNKAVWNNPIYKARMLQDRKELWADPTYRAKIESALIKGRLNARRVSSLQITLYSILDDLGIKYYREHENGDDDLQCGIGPYSWDCVIPRDGTKTLLIDCNGDYWHNLKSRIATDKAKATYTNEHHAEKYEIKYIWEHEFANHNKVVELIKYWMGITKIELKAFDFENIEIKECPAPDYRLLFSKYHYLANAGRGGIVYGAYLGDQLAAACVFSPPIRQNIDTSGYRLDQVRELSRLCIHPRYQKHNFASWFISRCMKRLPEQYKLIISYCDTTFNHDGATYKACNFVQDRIVPPDYWYVAEDGWVMHKLTLYQHAVRLKMKEGEFAEAHGYQKVWGKEKLRFIYKRE